MKLTSFSKTAVAAVVLAGGTIASPMAAKADSSNVQVTTSAGNVDTKPNDIQVNVSTNADGSKTINITMPKNNSVPTPSIKGGTATASTSTADSDDAKVGDGSVSTTTGSQGLSYNLQVNADTLRNHDKMAKDLVITLKDSKGNQMAEVTNVSLNDLMELASKQQASKDGTGSTSSITQASNANSESSESNSSKPSNQSGNVTKDSKNDSSSASTSSRDSSNEKENSNKNNGNESGNTGTANNGGGGSTANGGGTPAASSSSNSQPGTQPSGAAANSTPATASQTQADQALPQTSTASGIGTTVAGALGAFGMFGISLLKKMRRN